jgi:hypothetical protein
MYISALPLYGLIMVKELNIKAIPIILAATFLSLTAQSAEVVVQAGQAGSNGWGGWSYASAASMGYEGNLGYYTSAYGAAKTYTFTPDLPEINSYQVEVYNSCYSPRSTQVIHRINHAGGTDTQVLNQDCQSDPLVGQWRSLGTYSFNLGTGGSVVIDTTNSNNSYVGATAVRFVYEPNTTGTVNLYPSLTPSDYSIQVEEGDIITLSATAIDPEDGDISNVINWNALSQSAIGSDFTLTAGDISFIINLDVEDSLGAITTGNIAVEVIPIVDPEPEPTPETDTVTYDFNCLTLEPLVGFTTNKASVLPNVGKRCGKYVAELTDNANNKTLHFNAHQGRFDGVTATFPFEAIARNVGTANVGDLNSNHNTDAEAYTFVGLQVHHIDFNSLNSSHLVVGQRGNKQDTIEGKITNNGYSEMNDIGPNMLPNGRADIRYVGDADGNLTAYWQLPNTTGDSNNDNWMPYLTTGILPGVKPEWNGSSVYVGLITYASASIGVPFIGVADSLEVTQ